LGIKKLEKYYFLCPLKRFDKNKAENEGNLREEVASKIKLTREETKKFNL